MRLNQDCIRTLLLYIEENLPYRGSLIINQLDLSPYSKEELLYTADKLIEAGYLNSRFAWNMQTSHMIVVESLSYNGHKFLDTIRDDAVWSKTKNILSCFKSVSIEVISETASKVITNLINQQLGNV